MAIEIDGNITRRYYHTFTADDGTSYRWEIHQDGYDSTVDGAELLSASTRMHCVTRWGGVSDDEFSPILGSETTISFFEDDDDPIVAALIDNVSSSEEQFAVVIKDATSGDVKWAGFVDYEDVSRPEDGLVSLSLTARDGLGRLEDKYYVSNTATGALYEGRATLTSIITALLQQIGWGIDFYVATELYPAPYSGDEPLSNTDNPLDNLYAERLLFTAIVEGEKDFFGRSIPENAPIKSIQVLKAILERFCLRIFQADGAWHLYQVNQYYTTTEETAPDLDTAGERATKFRRWKYNSSGTYQSTDIFTHALTISNDNIKRSVGQSSLAKTYSAAQITYNHGAIRLIRQPGFDSTLYQPRGYVGYASSDQWITNDETKSRPVQLGEDAIKDAGWKVDDLDGIDWTQKTGYTSIFGGWANGSGTGANTIDEAIGDYKVYQTTKSTIPAGTSLRAVLRAFLINQSNSAFIHGDFNYALPLQIKINSTTPKYWIKGVSADSWTTTPNWVLMENPTPGQGIINFSNDLPDTDVSGTITISIGGPFDASEYNDQTDTQFDDISGIVCDHADLVYVLDDGTYNAEATSVINYVDRDVPKIKQIDTKIGDGPTNLSLGALTFDSDGLKTTATWAEGSYAASGSPTDSLNQLHSRIVLRGTNEPRNKHQAQYFDAGQILWPLYSIRRSSQNYIAWDIDYDWQADVTAGTWCEVKQFGFTDDLVSGIDSGAGSANWNSSYDRSGFLLSRLSKAFFSDTARRITRTTAYIDSGTDATYPQAISVEAIPDALLDVGDYINIVAPDLTFHTVRIAATQLPGDTTLYIDDPDNEGSNFNFPSGVSYPASIFMADDTVMTLARLGEQGFAVTVLGNHIGVIDEDILTPTSRTTLDVRNWAITMKTGDTVQVQQTDGNLVEVELTTDAPKGSTNITFPSTTLEVTDGDPIKPTGSVNRADFTVTAEAITAYLGNPGDVIATVTGSSFDGTNTSVTVSGLSVTIEAGESILFYTQGGTVIKAIVNATTSSSPIVLTAASGDQTGNITSGDKVVPGSVTGLRIDMDGIEVRADEIRSSNYSAGSAGWLIEADGDAFFNNISARGSITLTSSSSGVTNFSDFDLANISGDLDDIPDGGTYAKPLATALSSGQVLLSQAAGDLGDIADGSGYGKVLSTSLSAGQIVLSAAIGNLGDIADGSGYAKVLSTSVSAGKILLAQAEGDLDDIADGTYGKVLSTEISAGHIKILGADGTTTVIDGGQIQTGSIKAGDIAASTITADKLSVTSLDAITANIGDLTMASDGSIVFAGGGSLTPRSLQAATGTLLLGGQAINIGSGLIVASEDAGSVTIAGASTGSVSVGATSANLSLTTTTSGNISLTSAGNISLSASGSITAGGNGVVTEGGAVNTPATITSDTIITLYIDGTAYEINAEAV